MEFSGAMFVYIYIKRYKRSFSKKHERKKTMTAMEYSVNPHDLFDGGHVNMTTSCAHHFSGGGGGGGGDSPPSREPSPPTMRNRSNATSMTGVSEMFGASRPDVSHVMADSGSLDAEMMGGGTLVGTMGSGEPEDFVARPAAPSAPFASAHRSRSASRSQRDYSVSNNSPVCDASPYEISNQAHLHSPFVNGGSRDASLPTAYHNVGFGEPRVTTPARQHGADNEVNKQYKERNTSRDSSGSRLGNVDSLRRTTAI